MCRSRPHEGMSLIEVVIFIVVLGIALVGIFLLYAQVTRASVDPLIRKQALAIAQTMIEEIQLRAFTFCDPDDANVYTATLPSDCATQEGIGAEGETRYADPRFDNASDYHDFKMGSGTGFVLRQIDDPAAIAGLADYKVEVAVALVDATDQLPDVLPTDGTGGLRITVVASHVPTGTSVSLQGYRLRYAPNSP